MTGGKVRQYPYFVRLFLTSPPLRSVELRMKKETRDLVASTGHLWFLLYKKQFKLCISEPLLFIGSVVAHGTKKSRADTRGGGSGGVLWISRDRSSKLLFQRLLSIVYTTLLIQS